MTLIKSESTATHWISKEWAAHPIQPTHLRSLDLTFLPLAELLKRQATKPSLRSLGMSVSPSPVSLALDGGAAKGILESGENGLESYLMFVIQHVVGAQPPRHDPLHVCFLDQDPLILSLLPQQQR